LIKLKGSSYSKDGVIYDRGIMKQPDGRLGKIFNYYYLGLLFSQRLALPTVMESNICSAGKEFSTKIETEKTKAGRK